MDLTKRKTERFGEFVAELPISRTTVYALPSHLQPRSMKIGRCRVVLETRAEYLDRLARAQGVAP